jgi:L-iditol 2-dehydrogenase
MSRMRAVRLFAPGDVRCVEVEEPRIEQDDEVIVKVKACGVCGSDIPRVMVKGAYRYPITIGHEFAGEVQATGPTVMALKPGDRVTVMPLLPCGRCDYCRIGEYMLCDDYQYYGSRIDGAMAELVRVKAANVFKIPEAVDFEAAAMTDPAAIALHAVRKANVEPGQKVLVLGLGAIGFLALQWSKLVGAGEVFTADIFEEKLESARSLGADLALNARTQSVEEAVLAHTDGLGADAVIELVGSSRTQVQALKAVRKTGTVVYCGISYEDLLIPVPELNKILRGELVLKGAWNSSIAPLPINEWVVSLQAMADGRLRTAPLISHRFRLEDCLEAFEMMHQRKQVFTKVLFHP